MLQGDPPAHPSTIPTNQRHRNWKLGRKERQLNDAKFLLIYL